MRMMNELKHLFLYSANKKVYAPIDEKDKRRNSAILLLTPDLQTSSRLMNLPYLYNPNLFTSFYIDRNVSAYVDNMGIENVEFDEKEEETVSEAMINSSIGSIKFKFDDHTSMMDEKYIREVYNKNTVKFYARKLNIPKIPDKLNVVVHPNVTDLRRKPPKYIKAMGEDYYSYFENGTIHLISKMVYDPESMRGYYNTYLLIELLYALFMSYNENLAFVPTMGIACSIAGLEEYMDKEKNHIIPDSDVTKFAHTVNIMIKKHGYRPIFDYIRSGDVNIFTKYTLKNVVKTLNKVLFESDLSYHDRQRLLPSDFGIPDKRKYPIHDEDHVRAAVRMFNNCDPDDEEELAKAIIKRMKRFGISDIKVSASNRFRKYYKPEKLNESSVFNEKYISLNTAGGYNSDYISHDNQHPEFKDELRDVDFSSGNFGEIFTDKDGKLVAYYMTTNKDDRVWITNLKCMHGYEDAYNYLISRAIDRQNASCVSVDISDEESYRRYKKFGFNEYDNENGKYLMSIRESYENVYNWSQVQSVCDHLSSEELSRITFDDVYKDSKFVIKRLIARIGDSDKPIFIPAGFLDVYQFPSNPTIAQIVIAVDERYRGMGIASSLVENLINSNLHEKFNFDMYYWTAHEYNYASQNLALKHGFADTGNIDRYGRKVFIKKIKESNSIKREIPFAYNEGYISDESMIATKNAAIFFEADDPKYSQKLRKYLYAERMKNNKDVLLMYDQIRGMNPSIRKMYLKVNMYKKQNLFIDLSYYHALFLKNNIYKLDKAVDFYFDFLNRLINNREIDAEYSKKTIFIPIDNGVWPVVPNTELTDFRRNLNPISIIFRLIRTNPGALKNAWGNKTIIFVGSRGYFTIDFKKFELKDLARVKTNLRKLMSDSEIIKDEYEADDTINDDPSYSAGNKPSTNRVKHSDTPKAMAARMIDQIEADSAIKINNVSAIGSKQSAQTDGNFISSPHLRIASGSLEINRKAIDKENGIVVISIDPDGPNGFSRFSRTALSGIGNSIDTYCMPK